MDSRKQPAARREAAAAASDDEEEKQQHDQQQQQAASPKRRDDGERAVFGRLELDGEPDQINYRSTTVAPAFGMEPFGARPLMHGTGLPGMTGMLGMPAPVNTKKTTAKKAEAAPSIATRSDKTNYASVAPRELPPPPFRLELHTHFHVKNEAIQRLCSLVGWKLCELDTDFVFKADKCKWKVDYRRNGGAQRVNLNILIFKSGKEYVVEAQRREGDITASMHLYSELKNVFKRHQMLADKEKQQVAGVKRPAPKALPKIPLTPANVRDGVSALKGLLESKYADIQMQGVLGAISLSTEETARSGMASIVPQLVVLGQSKNVNVAKLVRVALSRLCDHPECRQAFIESDGWQFIVQCAAGGADVNPEVQRESLHVVECLCPLYSDELAKVEGANKVLELIQDWQNIDDPRLKRHACNAHQALKEAGAIA
ncbi:hypothetical protein Poli38472_002223 [Pythium oligandrum]|uniref:Uncharacterized protein n=1 Tax=Pythium oligandrum TaxID=41045 RepID=A0A8K1CJD8_PYTOL|nr:hypothetical protein Poli38472_002223 [Pythium oligandrum]|eukprot:TMW63282.1 hypothetical protein Poli38472_002223 [Pythium oligandrum]